MDRGLDPARFASVVSNDRQAAMTLTQSVIDPATRRVAWLEAMPDLSTSRERRAGFQAALAGTQITPLYLSGALYERSEGARLAAQLLDEEGGADALVTASYTLLEGVFDVFLERGGLPDGMRLATFGDHRLLDFLPQPINSALQDYDRIAELTLSCALAATEGHTAGGQQVVARHLRTRHAGAQKIG